MTSTSAGRRVFYGWWIVLACSLLNVFGGAVFYGFGAFVTPMADELGWAMMIISGGFSIYRLESGLSAPVAGYMLDRFGARRLVVGGSILMGLGFLLLSTVRDVIPFYIAFFVLSTGWGFATGPAVGVPLISKWFVRRRGLALSFHAAAAGLSGFLVPALTLMIGANGWRHTLVLLCPLIIAVGIPLALPLRHRPENYGMRPDGGSARDARPRAASLPALEPDPEVSFPLKNAMLTSSFWLLVIVFTIFQMAFSGTFVYMIPSLIKSGMEPTAAALAVTVVTLISTVGRFGGGWLSDMLNKKRLLVVIFILQAIGLFVFAGATGWAHLVPFLVTYGPSFGAAIVVRSAIIGEYYGRQNMGSIHGVLLGITMFGGIISPIIGGLIYDATGSYAQAFLLFSLLSLMSAIMMLFVRRPRLLTRTSLRVAEAG